MELIEGSESDVDPTITQLALELVRRQCSVHRERVGKLQEVNGRPHSCGNANPVVLIDVASSRWKRRGNHKALPHADAPLAMESSTLTGQGSYAKRCATLAAAMRYEAAVESHLVFHTQSPGDQRPMWEPAAARETVAIEFEGRRFVWHGNDRDADGTDYWPTVTTMVANADDYRAERVAMQRFLSAIAFNTRTPIGVFSTGGAEWKKEMEAAFVKQRRSGVGAYLHSAPSEVVMRNDDRLRATLAHYREGLTTGSPFFRFLGFWNALDVACESYGGRLPQWIRNSAERFWFHPGRADPPPADIWEYLSVSSRNAIAHAIPFPPQPALDPDDPGDRVRLGTDAVLLQALVEERVRERWGPHAVFLRHRQ